MLAGNLETGRSGAPAHVARSTRAGGPGEAPTSLGPPSGWLSSDPRDGGRFAPGSVLARRYRIVALLGRGGLGEVYGAVVAMFMLAVNDFPFTLDPSEPYAGGAWFVSALMLALAAIGVWLARAGRPMFGGVAAASPASGRS